MYILLSSTAAESGNTPSVNATKVDGLTVNAEGGNTASQAWMRALQETASISTQPSRLLANVIDELAAVQATAPALISGRENLSYGALATRANQYSRWALAQGLQKGQVVCLLMPNRPEYLAIWLGTRVGGGLWHYSTPILPSTAHCIKIANPNTLLLIEMMCSGRTHALVSDSGRKGEVAGQRTQAIRRHSGAPRRRERAVGIERALYILHPNDWPPKAVTVSHHAS